MKLPQLSLRDLFWLVALVAMACGWWVERRYRLNEAYTVLFELQDQLFEADKDGRHWRKRAQQLEQHLQANGYEVTFDGSYRVEAKGPSKP